MRVLELEALGECERGVKPGRRRPNEAFADAKGELDAAGAQPLQTFATG